MTQNRRVETAASVHEIEAAVLDTVADDDDQGGEVVVLAVGVVEPQLVPAATADTSGLLIRLSSTGYKSRKTKIHFMLPEDACIRAHPHLPL